MKGVNFKKGGISVFILLTGSTLLFLQLTGRQSDSNGSPIEQVVLTPGQQSP